MPTTENRFRDDMTRWLERAVIGLNLCPFAKSVHVRGKIRWVLCDAQDDTALMQTVIAELSHLHDTPADEVDTTLIVLTQMYADFDDFNDFIGDAEDELWVQGLEGELQIAHFHPQFQFADTQPDDPQNNTNRAPYPTIHLIRETSIDAAVAAMPDAAQIYERNIACMQSLGHEGFKKLLQP